MLSVLQHFKLNFPLHWSFYHSDADRGDQTIMCSGQEIVLIFCAYSVERPSLKEAKTSSNMYHIAIRQLCYCKSL